MLMLQLECPRKLITNILAAPVHNISDIKLSANWMGAVDEEYSNYDLYSAVSAINNILLSVILVSQSVKIHFL